MKVGDIVLYEGQQVTIISEVRPRCRCKGEGYFILELESGNRIKIPLTTVLEPYKPLTMANQNLEVHKLI